MAFQKLGKVKYIRELIKVLKKKRHKEKKGRKIMKTQTNWESRN